MSSHFHHHHHHHHEDHDHDDAPLDAANQSLADALRASFGILKMVMFVLVVLYCFSGVRCVEEQEQAVVFRFGNLLPGVRDSGLSWAFPPPIDETLVFPSKKANQFTSFAHWPHLTEEQKSQPLGIAKAGGGLNPTMDGSLLTADRGMVHMQWVVTYRAEDLRKFVLHVGDQRIEHAEALISPLLENAAIEIVSRYGAEEVTRGKLTDLAIAVRQSVNEQLRKMDTGLVVEALDIPKASVPGQTIAAFDAVTTAQSKKEEDVRKAQQDANDILNSTAGAAYEDLLARLDERDEAIAAGDSAAVATLEADIDEMLTNEISGEGGERIRQAEGYYTEVVQRVRGDVQEYQAVLQEFLDSPRLFVNRMWDQTRRNIMQRKGVNKHFVAATADEVRIVIPPDPKQRELDEMMELQEEAEGHRHQTRQQVQTILSE